MRSTLNYADVVWDGCLVGDSDLLESLHLEGELEWLLGLLKVQRGIAYCTILPGLTLALDGKFAS